MNSEKTIREVLSPFFSENIFIAMSKANQLKSAIEKEAKVNAGWFVFYQLVKKYAPLAKERIPIQNEFHPENLISLCSLLSIYTEKDLLSFVDFFNKHKGREFCELFSGPFLLLSGFRKVSFSKVQSIVRGKFQYEFPFRPLDSEVLLIEEIDFSSILKKNPAQYLTYVPESFDCDDFALQTKSWLSRQGLGNLAVFYCEVDAYKANGEFEFAHAVNLAVFSNENVLFFDPQNGKVWTTEEKMPWGIEGRNFKVRFLM